MAGYLKKIAVIKQLKGGFSADGGVISGLVKVETYAGYLKAEVSLINFAPLSEGRYVFGLTDGVNTVVFEDVFFECESALNCENGFAFVVCFCHGGASPIASGYCNQAASFLPALTQEIQNREKISPKKSDGAAYDDEAISEINYYENKADKDDKPLFKGQKEEELQPSGGEDEKAVRPVKISQDGKREQDGLREQEEFKSQEDLNSANAEEKESGVKKEEEIIGGLADGDFYSRMQADIERIFSAYPKDSDLEEVLEGGRFVKIAYGNGAYYAFGVLYIGGNPAYICYGVPSLNAQEPPKSLKGISSYVPCKKGGYWMTYQDARTGVSVGIEIT
ncbi:MAG: hypothetical protein ACI4MB_03610 [Candidatus Coproplasma sp.]